MNFLCSWSLTCAIYIKYFFFVLTDAACVHERDALDRTSLMYAVHFGHLDTIQLLLENKADINAKSIGKVKSLKSKFDEISTNNVVIFLPSI